MTTERNAYARQYYAERKAKGICKKCPAPRLANHSMCEDCKEDHLNDSNARKTRKILDGTFTPVGRKKMPVNFCWLVLVLWLVGCGVEKPYNHQILHPRPTNVGNNSLLLCVNVRVDLSYCGYENDPELKFWDLVFVTPTAKPMRKI